MLSAKRQRKPSQNPVIHWMYQYKAKITSVYDGDTVTATIDLGFNISFEVKLRLYGINTPELKGISHVEGKIARDILSEMVLNKEVIIKTEKDRTEKYGRYLATIMLDGENVNEKMVKLGMAKPYMI